MAQEKRLVWDLPLRLFHWLLVLSLIASWVTAELGIDWREIHMWLGYWMLGLLFFRIFWGIVGPRHARFVSFFPTPGRLWRYIKAEFTGTADETVGHNPLGSLMVVLMILLIGLQVVTGLFSTDDIIWTGPYYPAVTNATAKKLTHLHHFNFNLILAAIALHIIAVAFHGIVKKHNLVVPMITGKKEASIVPPDQAITGSYLWRALVVILVAAGTAYWVINAAPPPPTNFY
ncbi:MAG TPA: cytochrome b/b6 domain-containing protein [Alphaproteobacteria bacterium]|nr:cytochrome b/b6 domain-containing protein [Alphaproteobacteria bacterium]